MYDSPESDLKLNDVVEFLGVLTFDPIVMMDTDSLDENTDDLSEAESVQMPSGKVPRLHCLIHRKLETQHFLHGSSLLPEASTIDLENIPLIPVLLLTFVLKSLVTFHLAAKIPPNIQRDKREFDEVPYQSTWERSHCRTVPIIASPVEGT